MLFGRKRLKNNYTKSNIKKTSHILNGKWPSVKFVKFLICFPLDVVHKCSHAHKTLKCILSYFSAKNEILNPPLRCCNVIEINSIDLPVKNCYNKN